MRGGPGHLPDQPGRLDGRGARRGDCGGGAPGGLHGRFLRHLRLNLPDAFEPLGAVEGVRVVLPDSVPANFQSLLEERLRRVELFHVHEKRPEVGHAGGHLGMLRPERPFPDVDGLLVIQPRVL